MTRPTHRTVRTALIPWVIALVALFGLNVLIPDYSDSKKSESPDEIGLSQLAHHTQATGRFFNPQVFLDPSLSDGIGFLNSSSLFLCIENRRDILVIQSLPGAVQGRAPPVNLLS